MGRRDVVTRRRKHRPISVERDAALHALGLLGKKINWDHRPALSHRPYDPVTGLYDPDENDPRYLYPILAEENKVLANGNHIPLSGDTSVAAKLKRLAADQEEYRRRLLAKDAGDEPPAPIKKRRSRPIPGRPFQTRRKD